MMDEYPEELTDDAVRRHYPELSRSTVMVVIGDRIYQRDDNAKGKWRLLDNGLTGGDA